MDPELFFLILVSVRGPDCIFWHVGPHVLRSKVTIDMEHDLSLYVAELWGPRHGQVEWHGDVYTQRRDIKHKSARTLVLEVKVKDIDKCFDHSLGKLEAIVDKLCRLRLEEIELLLPEWLLANDYKVVDRQEKSFLHLPFELILRRRGQVELNRDVLKEDLGDVKGDWDEAGGLGIQIQGDVSILNDGANGVSVSDEGH